MTAESVLRVIAAVLVVMGIVNVYFVLHGRRLYRSVTPRSPLLLALYGVKVVVWLVGLFIAVLAARTALGLPTLPYGGIGVGIAILFLELLPLFINRQMLRFVDDDTDRNVTRDDARDTGRDTARDPVRDAARDAEVQTGRNTARDLARDEDRDTGRDTGRDEVRDPARDAARDAEIHGPDDGN